MFSAQLSLQRGNLLVGVTTHHQLENVDLSSRGAFQSCSASAMRRSISSPSNVPTATETGAPSSVAPTTRRSTTGQPAVTAVLHEKQESSKEEAERRRSRG